MRNAAISYCVNTTFVPTAPLRRRGAGQHLARVDAGLGHRAAEQLQNLDVEALGFEDPLVIYKYAVAV